MASQRNSLPLLVTHIPVAPTCSRQHVVSTLNQTQHLVLQYAMPHSQHSPDFQAVVLIVPTALTDIHHIRERAAYQQHTQRPLKRSQPAAGHYVQRTQRNATTTPGLRTQMQSHTHKAWSLLTFIPPCVFPFQRLPQPPSTPCSCVIGNNAVGRSPPAFFPRHTLPLCGYCFLPFTPRHYR